MTSGGRQAEIRVTRGSRLRIRCGGGGVFGEPPAARLWFQAESGAASPPSPPSLSSSTATTLTPTPLPPLHTPLLGPADPNQTERSAISAKVGRLGARCHRKRMCSGASSPVPRLPCRSSSVPPLQLDAQLESEAANTSQQNVASKAGVKRFSVATPQSDHQRPPRAKKRPEGDAPPCGTALYCSQARAFDQLWWKF